MLRLHILVASEKKLVTLLNGSENQLLMQIFKEIGFVEN